MAALIAGMKDASVVGEKQGLPKPQQAFHLCTSAAPSIMLHLITSGGIGQYRAVAVAASIQTMYVPRVGVRHDCDGVRTCRPSTVEPERGCVPRTQPCRVRRPADPPKHELGDFRRPRVPSCPLSDR
eukprot:FR737662.1.p2 GENE.FR737662.1~~FR737662.1.p2  ORF type:complete len:127 (+),score=1.99 FR737662.1:261-641(+)